MNNESKNLAVLRLKQVEAMVGLKHSSIYDMLDKGAFPKPIRLSKRAVGWLLHEVQEWLEGQVLASRPSRPSRPGVAI